MSATGDLARRIELNYHNFSKSQKKLANFITEESDKAVYITAARMGEIVGISESTVVRFATTLGYKGYPEMQAALEAQVRNSMNSLQRMTAVNDRMGQSDVLKKVLHSDAEKLRKTAESISQKDFEEAVNIILSARKIYIMGIRSCGPLASFLDYYLNLIFDNVNQLITSTSSELFEQMVRINEEDVIIGISFPRYSKRTQRALEFANARGAKVISITDNIHSPINEHAACSLICNSEMTTVVDSLVAPLSVINALLAALFMRRQKEVTETFTELERLWGEYQVYEENDLNTIHNRMMDGF